MRQTCLIICVVTVIYIGVQNLTPVTGTLIRSPRYNFLSDPPPVGSILVDRLHKLLVFFLGPQALRSAVGQAIPPTAAAIFI